MSASRTTSASFPRFSNLPTEIRCMVWRQFALPEKIYHMLFGQEPITEVIFTDPAGARQRMDIRRLMQVNSEARREVLRGHQLISWCKPRDCQGRPQQRGSFSFVNWELDLFSIELLYFYLSGNDNPWVKALRPIQNLALGIAGGFFDPHDSAWYWVAEDNCRQTGPEVYESNNGLESVKLIVLVLPRSTMWKGMHHMPQAQGFLPNVDFISDRKGYTSKSYCEDVGIGDERPIHLFECSAERVAVPDLEGTFHDDRDVQINEYGLHTVIDPANSIYRDSTVLFSDWAQMAVPQAKKQVTKGERDVECQIMVDYLGYRAQFRKHRGF